MKRAISHTEISQALDCQAKHAFGYTGHLTGGHTLKPKQPAVILREGRAWGRAVAALHAADDRAAATPGLAIADPSSANRATAPGSPERAVPGSGAPAVNRLPGVGSPIHALARANRALSDALNEDARQLQEHGFYNGQEHEDMLIHLGDVLEHYAATSEPLVVTDPEIELRVPIPSRTGGVSNRYEFHGHLDNLTVQDGRNFIVEYKLRGRLSTLGQAVRGRQYRRYVWAAERALGIEIAGVILDERLNEAPKPARWVQGKRKSEGRVPSHAKDQMTTPGLYWDACHEARVSPDPDTLRALEQRRWQARHTLIFRRSEIEEAGRELVSAAQLIAQLDSGALWPVRNESPQRCNRCAFERICANTADAELIDLDFERAAPKRDRHLEVAAA